MASCATLNQKESSAVRLGAGKASIYLADYLKSATITYMEEDESTVFGELRKVCFNDTAIFCLDEQGTKVSVFRWDGRSVGPIQHHGQGGGDYLKIRDMAVVNNQLVLVCSPHRLLWIARDGSVERTTSLPADYACGCVQGGLWYFYDSSNRSLVQLLEDGKTKVLRIEPELPACPKTEADVFYPCGQRLLYWAAGSDTLCEIKSGKVEPVLTLDYDNKQAIQERFAQPEMLTLQERMKLKYPAVTAIYPVGNQYILQYTYGFLGRGCLVDAHTDEPSADGVLLFGGPRPQAEYQGHLYAFVFASAEEEESLFGDEAVTTLKTRGVPSPDGNMVMVEYLSPQ
jgi:hypothetical protein